MYPLLFFTMGPTNKNIASGLKCLRYGFICIGTHLFLNPRAACYPPPYFYYRDPQIKILPQVSGVFDKGLFVLEPTSSLTLGERVTPLLIFTIKILPRVSSIWVYSFGAHLFLNPRAACYCAPYSNLPTGSLYTYP